MLVCDKCSARIVEGAKFCGQCGDPVTEADHVEHALTSSSVANVEILFGKSSSANYPKAVAICENLPTHEVTSEGKETQHRVTLPITEAELLVTLYDMVGSWKSSSMLINGSPATKRDLTFFGVGCYRNRQKAFKPEQYCFGEREFEANIWGCKRLNMPINEWGGGWLDYGTFDSRGVWHFDKARIRHDLELGINENKLCPVLDRTRVLDTLEKLPDAINPKTDKNWSYRTRYEESGNGYKEVAVGIRPNFKKIDRYIVGAFKPRWDTADHSDRISAERDEPASPAAQKTTGKRPTNRPKDGSSPTTIVVAIAVLMALLYFLSR